VKDTTLKYLFNSTKRRPQGNEIAPGISFETLQAHELILLLKAVNQLSLNLTVFYQELSDQITRNNDPGALNAFVNTGGQVNKGVEWDAKYQPLEDLLLYWNGSVNSARVKVVTNGDTEPHNSTNEPLFVPALTTFLGGEYNVMRWFKANLGLRVVYGIPYLTAGLQEDKKSVYFVDLTLRKEEIIKGLDVSLVALNLLDNRSRVPAFGEHAGNTTGTLAPEGRRFFGRVSMNW